VERVITVVGETIRLGQLLKLAGVAGDGAAAKALVQAGEVSVNGEVEARRGRQLRDGDRVAVGAETLRVATA
jgi:ribosome-associated protein